MIILISPAKTFNFNSKDIKVESTESIFMQESQKLVKNLQSLSSNDYQKLMGISENLARLNKDRHLSLSEENDSSSKEALFAFRGDVYVSMAPETFSKSDLTFCQNHLRILSGLYGVLRPFDLIKAHRLEMGTPLRNERGKNLYEWWGNKIAGLLNEDICHHKNKFYVNLASEEYFRSVKGLLTEKVITPIFQERKGDNFKVVGIQAKKARGLMTAYIIKNQIQNVKELESFSCSGYKFNGKLSNNLKLVFQRN